MTPLLTNKSSSMSQKEDYIVWLSPRVIKTNYIALCWICLLFFNACMHIRTHSHILRIFYNSLSPRFSSGMFSSCLCFPAWHTCTCLLCFSAIITTALPDAHKMGLSGKTFAPHISHKGSLWPITVSMEARDSHQLHAFFSSHVWTLAKARLALSEWCSLWQWDCQCLEKWHILAHIISAGKERVWITWRGHYVPHPFPKHSEKWIQCAGIAQVSKSQLYVWLSQELVGSP